MKMKYEHGVLKCQNKKKKTQTSEGIQAEHQGPKHTKWPALNTYRGRISEQVHAMLRPAKTLMREHLVTSAIASGNSASVIP